MKYSASILALLCFLFAINQISDGGDIKSLNTEIDASSGGEITINIGKGSRVIVTKDENRWTVQSLISNKKMVHLVVPFEGDGSWCAVDNLVTKDWIVDCGIDGVPDWRGRDKQNRELLDSILYIPIREKDSASGIWGTEKSRYKFNLSSKAFNLIK
jgi:hypothetical protein